MVKLKVLHFIWSASFGGIERVVINLCRAQSDSQETAPALFIGCEKGSFLEHIRQARIPHQFGGFKSGTDFRPSLYNKMVSLFNTYDVIHLHTFNPLVFMAAAKSGKPIVYTVHGNFNFGRKPRLSDKVNQLLRRYFLNKYAAHITFNSEFTSSRAISKYHLEKKTTSIIHNGIPIDEIIASTNQSLTSIQIPDKTFVVGTSSRFAGFKRIDRLISGFAAFAKDKKDTMLLLVGDGVMRSQLEAQVNQLGISDKVVFTGYQSNVSAFQKLMDVCVFPSQNEPFGLVAVETLALQKPTIAFYDSGGMLEILSKDFGEDIVASVEQLSERLQYYYENRKFPEIYKGAERLALAKQFDMGLMHDGMIRVYQQVTAQ